MKQRFANKSSICQSGQSDVRCQDLLGDLLEDLGANNITGGLTPQSGVSQMSGFVTLRFV